MTLSLLFVAFGVAGLAWASDWFVEGAAALADRYSVSPIVIGAVIVGLGTSLPELLVSAIAAFGHDPNLGLGNIVGSNTANLTLVLGVAVTAGPVALHSTTLRRELPITVAGCAAMVAFMWNAPSVIGGVVLGLAGLTLMVLAVRSGGASDDPLAVDAERFAEEEHRTLRGEAIRTIAGLIGTVVFAQLLVVGALDLADRFGWTNGFVGLTLVAVGTSLPELATSIQAVRRREDQLLVGNLLGSNLFNSLVVGSAVGVLGGGVGATGAQVQRGMIAMLVVVAGVAALMAVVRPLDRRVAPLLVGAFVASVLVIGVNPG